MRLNEDRAVMLKVLDTLDEAQQRWFVGREALRLGRGGLKQMSLLSGLSQPTITKGMRELQNPTPLRAATAGRVRREGGGRKRIEAHDAPLQVALEQLMDETTAGDPMSLLKWTSKSTYQIRDELRRQGHRISEDTVCRRLKELDYTLQANRKTKEGQHSPERDEQFRYLNRQAQEYMAEGDPVISVDAKKKERIGTFKNAGRKWHPHGQADQVNVYDYPSLAEGTAALYGTYDQQANQGLVNVGRCQDTAEFAVESVRQWWLKVGRRQYPQARRLLICADGGGSNGSRNRAWKYFLQQFSNESGLALTVCHYPPGASKWNKIEHRLFSFISLNWKGEPLVSFETVVNLISATKTRTGLKVKARLEPHCYTQGKKIPDEAMAELNLHPHEQQPHWNYSLKPQHLVNR